MHSQNHNGGPPIDSDAKMRWVRVNISDILEGMDGLSWEQRGYYVTALFKMYARMEGLPYEEKAGSSVMRCDVRTYRRLRDHLIGIGKFYTEDGMLKNTRVEREITDFCREVKRRREAALEREKRRRNMADRQEVPADFQPTSPGLPTEFQEKSSEDPGDFHENARRKPNEINVCTATTVPEENHNSGGNQKPETRNQKEERVASRKGYAPDPPHMNGVGFIISAEHGLIIPMNVVEKWKDKYKSLPDLEAAMQKFSTIILREGFMHAGWQCPEGWMAKLLADDNAKAERENQVTQARIARVSGKRSGGEEMQALEKLVGRRT